MNDFKHEEFHHKVVIKDDIDEKPKIVIDQGKAFCQRIKFVMRLKRRMRDFKNKKDAIAKEKFACNKDWIVLQN